MPAAGLTPDSSGNLYGTTATGGVAEQGTVYKLDAQGNEAVLYSFAGGNDGAYPSGDVLLDPGGNLYGVTVALGPPNMASIYNQGTVYRLDSAGNKSTLYTFTGGADGSDPFGHLVRDAAGSLYGTTAYGGTSKLGVVYKLDSGGPHNLQRLCLREETSVSSRPPGRWCNPTPSFTRFAVVAMFSTSLVLCSAASSHRLSGGRLTRRLTPGTACPDASTASAPGCRSPPSSQS